MPTKKAKRADGRYQVSATVGHDERGIAIRKYFYGETQKEAVAKKNAYLQSSGITKDARSMSLSRWIEEWKRVYVTGGYRNRENSCSILNVFEREMNFKAKRSIAEIKPADIQRFANSKSSCSKSHVSKVRRTIQSLFDTAKDNGYIAASPCQGIVWVGERTGFRESVSAEMDSLILNNWRVHPAGIWAMFVRYAGLRPSEAFALRREDIDEEGIHVHSGSHFEHGQLVITEGKTKSEAGQRTIPILAQLRPVIEMLPSKGLVCLSATGKPVSQSAYKRNWQAFLNRLEDIYNGRTPRNGRRTDCLPENWKPLPKLDMYSLRHSYCSMLYDAGVDVKTAQYLMGHSDLEVTLKIYTHLSEQKKQHSYDTLHDFANKMMSKMMSENSKTTDTTEC